MARVYLVHWSEKEVVERTGRLESSGHEVESHCDSDRSATSHLAQFEPDVVVIDLGRLPSHGRQMAVWLRGRKATRHVPIVCVDGDAEKVARLQQDLPDAIYTTWSRIKSSVKKALANPPSVAKVVSRPDYSGTPLAKKLGIKPDSVLALVAAPRGFAAGIEGLPDNVSVRTQARGACNVIVLFTKSEADMKKRFVAAAKVLAPGGGLWVAWPKKASGIESNLSGDVVRTFGLKTGLVDNKICAIDETWSGLRFMRRTK